MVAEPAPSLGTLAKGDPLSVIESPGSKSAGTTAQVNFKSAQQAKLNSWGPWLFAKLKQSMKVKEDSKIELSKLGTYAASVTVAIALVANKNTRSWTTPIMTAAAVENYPTIISWTLSVIAIEPYFQKYTDKSAKQINNFLLYFQELYPIFNVPHTARANLATDTPWKGFFTNKGALTETTQVETPKIDEHCFFHRINPILKKIPGYKSSKPEGEYCLQIKVLPTPPEPKVEAPQPKSYGQVRNLAISKLVQIFVLLTQVKHPGFILKLNLGDCIKWKRETGLETKDRYDPHIPKKEKYSSEWLKKNPDWKEWGPIYEKFISLLTGCAGLTVYIWLLEGNLFTKEQIEPKLGYLLSTTASFIMSCLLASYIDTLVGRADNADANKRDDLSAGPPSVVEMPTGAKQTKKNKLTKFSRSSSAPLLPHEESPRSSHSGTPAGTPKQKPVSEQEVPTNDRLALNPETFYFLDSSSNEAHLNEAPDPTDRSVSSLGGDSTHNFQNAKGGDPL